MYTLNLGELTRWTTLLQNNTLHVGVSDFTRRCRRITPYVSNSTSCLPPALIRTHTETLLIGQNNRFVTRGASAISKSHPARCCTWRLCHSSLPNNEDRASANHYGALLPCRWRVEMTLPPSVGHSEAGKHWRINPNP